MHSLPEKKTTTKKTIRDGEQGKRNFDNKYNGDPDIKVLANIRQ